MVNFKKSCSNSAKSSSFLKSLNSFNVNNDNLMDIEENSDSMNYNNFNKNTIKEFSPLDIMTENNRNTALSAQGSNFIPEGENLNITYFSTSEGSMGVIIKISKEIFDYLNFLQKEILKFIISPCNFEYDKWRSVKVSFLFKQNIKKFFVNEKLNFSILTIG